MYQWSVGAFLRKNSGKNRHAEFKSRSFLAGATKLTVPQDMKNPTRPPSTFIFEIDTAVTGIKFDGNFPV